MDKIKHTRDNISKLLTNRPDKQSLLSRNIINTKEDIRDKALIINQNKVKLSSILSNRPNIKQMKKIGVLKAAANTLITPKIAIQQRKMKLLQHKKVLNQFLSNRINPYELLHMTESLELELMIDEEINNQPLELVLNNSLETIPSEPEESEEEEEPKPEQELVDHISLTQAIKTPTILSRKVKKRRKSSFFDGIYANQLQTQLNQHTNDKNTSFINELIRIDHVVAAYKRKIENDQGTKGGVYIWGKGYHQLGFNDIHIIVRPQLIKSLQQEIITMISCGKGHILALTLNGTIYSWGANNNGQLGLGDNISRSIPFNTKFQKSILFDQRIKYIACGINVSGCISDKGQLYTWGYARDGILGYGKIKNDYETLPIYISNNIEHESLKMLSFGTRHACILTENGLLYSWGIGITGALGHEELKNYSKPKPLIAYHNYWSYIDCGHDYTAAIGFNGSVYTWGKNDYGQLGRQGHEHIPAPVMSLWRKHIIKISCNRRHTVAITEEGAVFTTYIINSTNDDNLNDFNHNSSISFHKLLPHHVYADAISTLNDHIYAITVDGKVIIWNALNNGSLIEEKALFNDKTLSSIYAGDGFYIAIGTWHVNTANNNDLHQNLDTCHLPMPNLQERLRNKYKERRRSSILSQDSQSSRTSLITNEHSSLRLRALKEIEDE